jgi:hypothetical protein
MRLTDERLQDYVDGRLSEAERAEVEALLRDDPEAARRVAAWRSIGPALRDDETELSPGFYARARERFEESRAPRGWRLLSWETAGLAAAAVLAVAIFVPELMRDPTLGPETVQPQRVDEERFRADSPAPAVEGERLEQEDSAEAVAPEAADVAGEFAPLPPAAAEAESVAIEMAQEPAPRSRGKARTQSVLADAVYTDRDEATPATQDAAAKKTRSSLPSLGTTPSNVLPVGSDLAPPRGVSSPTGEVWDLFFGTLGDGGALRRVVVGLDGADCETLVLRLEDDVYRVTVGRGGDAAGCAFLLPDDGVPVVLDE